MQKEIVLSWGSLFFNDAWDKFFVKSVFFQK